MRRNLSRDEVAGKYDRIRNQEETLMTKRMTLLNCRRNSAQLKVDQCTRVISSKPRIRVRKDSDKKIVTAVSEEKLKEMSNKLLTINEEIYEQRLKNKV